MIPNRKLIIVCGVSGAMQMSPGDDTIVTVDGIDADIVEVIGIDFVCRVK